MHPCAGPSMTEWLQQPSLLTAVLDTEVREHGAGRAAGEGSVPGLSPGFTWFLSLWQHNPHLPVGLSLGEPVSREPLGLRPPPSSSVTSS